MDNKTFNDIVDTLAKLAVSCDFCVGDAESSVWDGIKDAGCTWEEQPITDKELNEAVEAAKPLVKELEDFYLNTAWKYMRMD